MPDNKIHSWVVEGSSLRIDCADEVLDAITTAVRNGFHQFRHGGMEVGGILIGSTQGAAVRVVDAIPVSIEYARGPYFLLSDTEHEALDQLIDDTARQLSRKGLEVVGFYESHTRRDISLAEADMETFDGHFPAALKVCIVEKPEKENVTRTAVYIRGEDGSILEAVSAGYSLERDVEEAAAAPLPAPEPVAFEPVERELIGPRQPVTSTAIPAFGRVAAPPAERWQPPEFPRRGIFAWRKKWIFAGAAALVAALAAAIWTPRGPSTPPIPQSVSTPVVPSAPIIAAPPSSPPREVAEAKPVAKAKSSRKARGKSRNQRTRRR